VDLAVAASGSPISFGDVFVGTSSVIQTVTLTNTAAGAVTGIGVGGFAAPFARAAAAAGGTCPTTATFSLASGASCTVGLVFSPAVLDPAVGYLAVTAGSGFAVDGTPLQLTGNGLFPSLTPVAVDFGDAPVGTPVLQMVTLSNANNVNSNSLAFPISTLQVIGAGFSRPGGANSGTCGAMLAAGATCTIGVRFSQPASSTPTGITTGTLTVKGNGNQTALPAVPLKANSVAIPPPVRPRNASAAPGGSTTASLTAVR